MDSHAILQDMLSPVLTTVNENDLASLSVPNKDEIVTCGGGALAAYALSTAAPILGLSFCVLSVAGAGAYVRRIYSPGNGKQYAQNHSSVLLVCFYLRC